MNNNSQCSEEKFQEVLESKLHLKKFIIYPYGKWGKYAEKILHENKIENYLVLDRSFSERSERNITFDDVKCYNDYYVLLCSDNKAMCAELRNQIRCIMPADHIIDVCYYRTTFEFLRYKNRDPRIAVLESCAREIYERKIKGDIAEAGVYRGGFSRYMNELFSDRLIYLFDTFEGFNKNDIEYDRINNFSLGTQDWSGTSVQHVLEQMMCPDNCVIRKGYFPDTAKDVSENHKFCFVSLDMDLYQPTYEGLKFFYSRLSYGGYIFTHDCRNIGYKGARQAVLDFCEEYQIGYTILTDDWGTAVITKSGN